MKWFRLLLILMLFGAPLACRKTPRNISPAFYHWQTGFQLSWEEIAYLDSIGCKKLYIKILDVGINRSSGVIEPYSRLEIKDSTGIDRYETVSVIFITNAVFENITAEKTDWLVEKITASIGSFPFSKTAREIQFDCDWTASTRAAFFIFLKKIKKALPDKVLSATIRLHQYKFPQQTGVPPVSRGMLMFYNTGDIESENTQNSIFDLQDAEKYVYGARKDYPLPLDLALPVFSWTLVYREGEFWKIINGVPPDLQDTARFETVAQDAARLQVKKATFLAGHYLRPGDHLRIEHITNELLSEAAGLAAQTDLATNTTVAFFYLDSVATRRFPPKIINSICQKTGSSGMK